MGELADLINQVLCADEKVRSLKCQSRTTKVNDSTISDAEDYLSRSEDEFIDYLRNMIIREDDATD